MQYLFLEPAFHPADGPRNLQYVVNKALQDEYNRYGLGAAPHVAITPDSSSGAVGSVAANQNALDTALVTLAAAAQFNAPTITLNTSATATGGVQMTHALQLAEYLLRLPRAPGDGGAPGGPQLPPLGLTRAVVNENAPQGWTVGVVLKQPRSVVTQLSNAGGRFLLVGDRVVTGPTALDYESNTTHTIDLLETNPAYANSPRQTSVQLYVYDVAEANTLSISGTPASSVALGAHYSFTPLVSGGTAPYSFALSGALPPGLVFNTTSGAISGQAGASETLSISGVPNATGSLGIPYSFIPTVSGGVPPYSFALSGALPPGLSFNSSTGAVTGTPIEAGEGAVNLTAPLIQGQAEEGWTVTLDLGSWQGNVDYFEVAVYDHLGGQVLERQQVTQDSELELTGVLGRILTLRVWAVSPGGNSVYADSAQFGPVAAAARQFIQAVAFLNSAVNREALSAFPHFNVRPVYEADDGDGSIAAGLWPQSNTNTGLTSLLYGLKGSAAAALDVRSVSGFGDARLKGRSAGNGSAAQQAVVIEVPVAGTYIVHAAASNGTSSGATVNFSFWDGDPAVAGAVNRDQFTSALLDNTVPQVCDAMGNITTETEWVEASLAGGAGREISVSVAQSGKYYVAVGRASGGSTTFHQYVAVFRKLD